MVVKIRVPFGSLIQYGTYYFGYPNKDPNFDNHPYGSFRKLGGTLGFLERVTIRVL